MHAGRRRGTGRGCRQRGPPAPPNGPKSATSSVLAAGAYRPLPALTNAAEYAGLAERLVCRVRPGHAATSWNYRLLAEENGSLRVHLASRYNEFSVEAGVYILNPELNQRGRLPVKAP